MRATLSATRCGMAITGAWKPFDMDQMMELDMEVCHHNSMESCALTTMADALPGLGIVAAVLGWSSPWAPGGPPKPSGTSGGGLVGNSWEFCSATAWPVR